MVLLLWVHGHRRYFNASEGFGLVVGVAAGDIDLNRSAVLAEEHLMRRLVLRRGLRLMARNSR
ncbi:MULTISPECIES: hypothetical protein [unclassified Arthrobacter]|uniref:hypothetical protein n=1 Tax=unclassified Arthrobacter TaxID=235627 RepID=UPI0033922138